ncbi:Alpha/Beta hydrolase protein [Mycena rosella]|uniref:Carboxylic ester hydrolase n=1 Tax=Mycena rosella TaxID=1033263 RepID=A0AAD7CS89_MYCRO|nr:Alpha/Beta hydrolase protein [Mycena rosella]
MFPRQLSVVAAVLLITAPLPAVVAAPVIDLGYAQYQGAVNTSTNVTTFHGIRYAAAPINELRFRAPQPPPAVTGVQQATTLPDMCLQTGPGSSSINPLRARTIDVGASEDCLTLSVSYPSNADGAANGLLPTIVWIHGGAYTSGAGSMYRGTDLVAQSNRGIVAVVIQYRLGLFGFLPGTAVKENGALNAGLLDQEFALRWVNKHISKFGGDPSKVTIWGESAGAGSVVQHVVANGGNTQPQLFRAAITSSIALVSQYKYDDRIPELLYSEVVADMNCTTATNSLACLRAGDVNDLQSVNLKMNAAAFVSMPAFSPVVDGQFITQRPSQSMAQGKVNGRALLAITNAFEGAVLVDPTSVNVTNYALEVFPNFGPAQAKQVGSLYAGLGTQLFQSSAVIAESLLICPTYYLLRAFPGSAFKGEFAVTPATHGMDILSYFPSVLMDAPALAASVDPAPYSNPVFTDAFAQSFTSFAISLDPNIKVDPTTITPPWSKWHLANTEMVFNKTETDVPLVKARKTDDALLRRCQFWESVTELTAQ